MMAALVGVDSILENVLLGMLASRATWATGSGRRRPSSECLKRAALRDMAGRARQIVFAQLNGSSVGLRLCWLTS
jgi:hypothetical protein